MSRFTVFVKNDPNRQVLLLPTNPSKKHFGLVLDLANTDFSSTNLGSINIKLIDVDAVNKREWTRLTSGYGCLGFVNIEKDIYLVIISSQSAAFQYPNGEQIYRVTDVQFINLIHSYYDVDFDKLWAYERDHYDSEDEELKELKYNYDSVRLFLSQNFFYYSVEVDLTRFTQSRVNQSQIYQFDDTFLWNSEMVYPLRSFFHNLNPNKKKLFLDNGYLVPLIQGYCDYVQLSTGEDLVVGIISRMGWKRAGTRFNTRGIDDSGHVANSTETEIIFYNSNFLFSFLQIRGSVPAFWEQNGLQLMGHKIQISRSLEATLPAFNQHIQKLLQRYKNVHVINLLSQKEGAESQLGNLYANLVAHFLSSQNVKGNINFTDFDFHAVCKGNHFENALLLVDQLETQLDQFGFCGVDLESGRLMHTQEGVFRTNCLDCLDRTNVIQGLFTQYHLKRILQELGLSQLYGQVIPILSQLTGKNGDAISKIYAGTGALKSSFTKSGKSSIAGLLNDASKSVNRMYTGAVTDKIKQELTDMLLGKLPGQVKLVYDGPSSFDSIPRSPIQQAHELQQSNPSQPPKKITVHCGTYNVNGRHPNDHTLADWILPPKLGEDIPDLYIMSFQEIVELTPSQILNADLGRKNIWQNILIKDINTAFPDGNYVFLSSEQLVGITILIFAKASILPYINQLEKSIKKTGFSGIAGNKGAAAIRFVVGEISFCFVACHFASGQSKVEERNFDYQTIHNELTFGFNRTINHHHVVVYMGDFNYRINLSNEQVRLMAHNPKYTEQLQNYDQLKISMQRGYAFRGFTESPIDFFPTYRYDIGTDNYDTSEKRRIPAWTDRILYRGAGVNCSYYTRAELTGSDHKPVMAGFDIDLTKCLDEVKQRMNRPAAHDKPVISFSERNNIPKPVPKIISEKSQPPPRPPKPQLANLIDFDSEKPTLDCKGLPPPSDNTQQWWSLNSENNHSDTMVKDLVAIEADNDPFNYQFPPHSWNPQISTNPFRQPGFHFPDFSIQSRAGSVKKISDSWTPRNQKLMD